MARRRTPSTTEASPGGALTVGGYARTLLRDDPEQWRRTADRLRRLVGPSAEQQARECEAEADRLDARKPLED